MALLLLFLFALSSAWAEQAALPASLTEIEPYAFAGDASLREVTLSEGVREIGEGAFQGCAGLGWITVPNSVTAIGQDALAGCAEDLLIRTVSGSAAHQWALAHETDYQADTVYRALLIGQTYDSNATLRLTGPKNDVAAMLSCLSGFSGTAYRVRVERNLTAQGMLDAIADAFSAAQPQDVSLLYYSGHGIFSNNAQEQGALLGVDAWNSVTASQLRAALDGVAGRKIVIIDACYSGNMIAPTARAASPSAFTAADFAASFISAFSRKSRANLAGQGYFVLTAAAQDEESYEDEVDGTTMGLFTACFTKGCADGTADLNHNGVFTLNELYQYTAEKMLAESQHVQVYPSACAWFGLLREE